MRINAIDEAGRGALASKWIPTPGWKRARVRVEAGLGGDLAVRVRGRNSATQYLSGSPPYRLAKVEPLVEAAEFDLAGAAAIQLIADVGRGRLVRVSVEEVAEETPAPPADEPTASEPATGATPASAAPETPEPESDSPTWFQRLLQRVGGTGLVAAALALLVAPPTLAADSFDHFSGTSAPAGWTFVTSSTGVGCMNGTIVAGSGGTCPGAVAGESFLNTVTADADDVAFAYSPTISKTESRVFWITRRSSTTQHIALEDRAAPAGGTDARRVRLSGLRALARHADAGAHHRWRATGEAGVAGHRGPFQQHGLSNAHGVERVGLGDAAAGLVVERRREFSDGRAPGRRREPTVSLARDRERARALGGRSARDHGLDGLQLSRRDRGELLQPHMRKSPPRWDWRHFGCHLSYQAFSAVIHLP